MTIENLFTALEGNREQIIPLLEWPGIRIERIVSNGEPSPPDFWYDQENDEWVALLRGTATLRIEDGRMLALKEGDYLLMERHVKHRVEVVSQDAVWLAVHGNVC
jgi:cupin 2 domain-containing protein